MICAICLCARSIKFTLATQCMPANCNLHSLFYKPVSIRGRQSPASSPTRPPLALTLIVIQHLSSAVVLRHLPPHVEQDRVFHSYEQTSA